jgi:hypothetical protein
MSRASVFKGFGTLLRSELVVLFGRRRTWAMLATIACIPIFLAIAVQLSGSTIPPGEGPPFLDRVSQNGLFVGFTAMILAIPLFLLYFARVLFAVLIDRRRNSKTDLSTNASPIDTPEEI